MYASSRETSAPLRLVFWGRRLAFCLLLLIALGSTACLVIPLPAPHKEQGPSDLHGSTSTDFIRIGQTSREEIVQKLGWLSVNASDALYFWGRWATSDSGVEGIIGGPGGGAEKFFRNWGGRNVLVDFDDAGRVKSFRTFKDGELLKAASDLAIRRIVSVDLSQPLHLAVWHRHSSGVLVPAELVLRQGELDFVEPQREGRHDFSVSPGEIKSINLSKLAADEIPSDFVYLALHFQKQTKAGKHITVQLGIPNLLLLVSYLERVQPKVLPLSANRDRKPNSAGAGNGYANGAIDLDTGQID